MHVTISQERLTWFIDELLARWRSTPKGYPFNRPDAIVPQRLVPSELRKNSRELANFYVAINCHMKGRIASAQAFRGHIALWQKYPWFYEPRGFLSAPRKKNLEILEEFSLIDRENTLRDLAINYHHLDHYYEGDALNLTKGITSWDEALRRILNKRTKRAVKEAGYAGQGLYGHQEKMVSMTLYWHDWEQWLNPRFAYPAPSDIQNLRGGVTSGSLITDAKPGDVVRGYQILASKWREGVLRYVIDEQEDPIDVADVLWLHSSLMCGNSPLTSSTKEKERAEIFPEGELKNSDAIEQYLTPKNRKALEQTCMVCICRTSCNFAVPARPYYDKGQFVFRPRPKVEDFFDLSQIREPTFPTEESTPLLFE